MAGGDAEIEATPPTRARTALRTARSRLSPAWPPLRRALRRALLCVACAGLLGSPLAVGWAVTHTVVQDQIGTSPTTFTLSTKGASELRLGLAGTIYVPQSVGPLGIVATVDGPGDPGAGDGDLANYVRPEMLRLYAGLFHDPRAAVDEYVHLVESELRRQLVISEAVVALGGGAVLMVITLLLPRRPIETRRRARVAGAVALALVATGSMAVVQLQTSAVGRGATEGAYELDVLDGSLASGATTNSPLISTLAGATLDKAKVLVDRQTEREVAYRDTALRDLEQQQSEMKGPRDGETAVLMQSDMHCNTTMIRLQSTVMSMLHEAYDDQPALMAITGDLTTNGTGAEGTCIRDEAAIADGSPVAAITGNHETDVSESQMRAAAMTVLDGSVDELGGVRVLGDGDPNRTELFGDTVQRGSETQEGLGQRLRAVAEDSDPEDRPQLVLVHEAYAAQAFLGIDSVSAFLSNAERSTLDQPTEDDVEDVPASAVFYGHWHRDVEPRVVWNSDGTWTLVMELDTSGGAIDTPTINNFSTPWSRPQQEASFPVVFLSEETGLVTGYQLYRFDTDGTATVLPRVNIGTRAEQDAAQE